MCIGTLDGITGAIIRRGAVEQKIKRYKYCAVPAEVTEQLRRAELDVENACDASYARQTGGLIRIGYKLAHKK